MDESACRKNICRDNVRPVDMVESHREELCDVCHRCDRIGGADKQECFFDGQPKASIIRNSEGDMLTALGFAADGRKEKRRRQTNRSIICIRCIFLFAFLVCLVVIISWYRYLTKT